MEHKTIGNIVLPVLGVGSWDGLWGRSKRPEPSESRDQKTTAAVVESIKRGMTHIDTAELYGDGYAEEIIGKAIKQFDRSSLFITSKVSGNHLDYRSVLNAVEGSLGRDYIDLYLVHWPSDSIPISETMSAMNTLVDNGTIRHIGLSNFSLSQIVEAKKFCKYKFAAVQVEYNLRYRDNGRHTKGVESEVIPYCQKNGIFVVAYKPLGFGEFAKPGNELIDRLADKYGKTTAQISLNWLLSKDNVVTIPGTTNLDHMVENLGSIGWKMEEGDLALLDEMCVDA